MPSVTVLPGLKWFAAADLGPAFRAHLGVGETAEKQMTRPSDYQPMRKLEFSGIVRSNQVILPAMVIPGRKSLVLAPDDWPEDSPGTLNIAIQDGGFPDNLDELGKGDGLKKLDEGNFRPEMAIPPWRIAGNTMQPTHDEPLRGSAQVWRAKLEVASTGEFAACWFLRRLGSDIVSQIELVSDEHLRRRMNLCDGMVVKVTVWEAESKFKPNTPSEAIADWCEATAGRIEPEFGTEKAMGYLVGEKFLNFLEFAESNSEWREASTRSSSANQVAVRALAARSVPEDPARLGTLGHAGSGESTGRFVRPWRSPSELKKTPQEPHAAVFGRGMLLPE